MKRTDESRDSITEIARQTAMRAGKAGEEYGIRMKNAEPRTGFGMG
jgi:hypothetical protein